LEKQVIKCYHCGDECRRVLRWEEHDFCCEGCRTVYEILQQTQLCGYYELDKAPGRAPASFNHEKWAFLDNSDIAKSLLQFQSDKLSIINLNIPGMHCVSCIYLLENLHKIQKGIVCSEVNFVKKDLLIKYNPHEISLRKIVETLCAIGYVPTINLKDAENKLVKKSNHTLIYKIGIAGFCFANIMALSLPEYFDGMAVLTRQFTIIFRYLGAILALPVILYSAQDYFISAWQSIRVRRISMDFIIAVGLAGLVIQSYYDVLSGRGSGYFDSLTGLVFFLLISRFIQQRTFNALSFDRDYKSYFPLAATRLVNNKEESININNLNPGDHILLRHEELIPADSLLLSDAAYIDYSFVTGESEPQKRESGNLIYAGGRNKGQSIELIVSQKVSHSYLTKLWNSDAFRKKSAKSMGQWADQIAVYFTIAILVIASATAVYWWVYNPSIIMKAVTSVLIIACPCVLALTIPYTFGAVLRVFGRNGLYLKNATSTEQLADIDTIVFDKTGTLTSDNDFEIKWEDGKPGEYEQQLLSSLIAQSLHPVSRQLRKEISIDEIKFPIINWEETVGSGVSATIDGNDVKLGKYLFINPENAQEAENDDTYIGINGELHSRFSIKHNLRKDAGETVKKLKSAFNTFLLTGDGERDKEELFKYFTSSEMRFRQSPHDKLEFIANEKANGHKIMMIGDGINDAGALKESNFGITITDDINAFTPASDAILDANQLAKLPRFAAMAKSVKTIILGAFIFSAMYNCIGLSFAVRGVLHPWIAAILMPVSSITVVLYSQLAVNLTAKKYKL